MLVLYVIFMTYMDAASLLVNLTNPKAGQPRTGGPKELNFCEGSSIAEYMVYLDGRRELRGCSNTISFCAPRH